MEFIESPLFLVGSTVGVVVVVGIVGLFIVLPKGDKKEYVNALVFTRGNVFKFIKAQVMGGVAVYNNGGFEIESKAALNFSEGHSYFEFGEAENRRPSKPIFITRDIDTGALRFSDEGVSMIPFNRTAYNKAENLIAETARTTAANKLNGVDIILVSLGALVLILAAPLAVIGMRLALQ